MLTMSSCIAPRVVPLTCSLPIFTPMRRRSLMTASKCYKMDCDSVVIGLMVTGLCNPGIRNWCLKFKGDLV